MSKASIRQELTSVLHMISNQAMIIAAEAERIGCEPLEIRSTSGEFMMVPLLVARANALAALANLEKKS